MLNVAKKHFKNTALTDGCHFIIHSDAVKIPSENNLIARLSTTHHEHNGDILCSVFAAVCV